MPRTCSFPTGQVHPFKFKSPVWGVNRFVSPWLRFLLPWPVSRDGKWLLLCLGPWVVQHQCSHNRSGSPAHGPQGDGVPACWRPRELGRSPASFPNTAPSDGRVTCYGNGITPRDAHSPTLGPCSTPVTESLLQPGVPPTSRRLPVWWPCSPTCHPCHTQGAQLTPSHWPPTLCHEVLPPPRLPPSPGPARYREVLTSALGGGHGGTGPGLDGAVDGQLSPAGALLL